MVIVKEPYAENFIFVAPDLKTIAAKISEMLQERRNNIDPDILKKVTEISKGTRSHANFEQLFALSIYPMPDILPSVLPNAITYILDEE